MLHVQIHRCKYGSLFYVFKFQKTYKINGKLSSVKIAISPGRGWLPKWVSYTAIHALRQRTSNGLIWISCHEIVSSECSFLVQRMQISDLELKQLATSFLAKDWSTDALSSLHCTTVFKPQKNKIEAAILQFDDKLTFNYCVLIAYLIFWMRKVERWLVSRNSNPTIKRSLPGGSGWLGTRRCQNVAMNWC